MNIVLFDSPHGPSRNIQISGFFVTCIFLFFILIASVLGGWATYWYLGKNQEIATTETAQQLHQELALQKQKVAKVQEDAERQLEALRVHLASLQTRLIRLDALGKRLTDIADLDDDEFNFDQAPAVGGPESFSFLEESLSFPAFNDTLNTLDQQLEDRQQQLEMIEALLDARRLADETSIFGRPVFKGWLSSPYGRRLDPFTGRPTWHEGVDIAAPEGTPIIAVGGGVVTWAGSRYGYGYLVEIDHGNGYSTRYAHCKKINVSKGDRITRGQKIATMGNTGRSTGPHVHFEVRYKDKPINPAPFMNKTG
ncbi:Peptidase family M23 [Allopseudospirillum japonicum]|uniref:Peptidase family M23 n=1 Tax=Allopseudospirillum japonicum TaxID=64971 RepID=A0A1H6QJN4_9GAMM|nr:M23 family metallopeptidase [Allopseudospirillum japonicum]SEI40317.1 Peptidase family M23 [Allopseudospirillum japonicum]